MHWAGLGWAGMGLAHFAQLAELSKGCNGLGWAGLSKGMHWAGVRVG